MTFAFTPDDRPPRLVRYVDHGTIPSSHVVALYDESKNLLIINKDLFEMLGEYDREQVLRTHETVYMRIVDNRLPEIYTREFKQAAE